jgi:uncharacterized protein YwgA
MKPADWILLVLDAAGDEPLSPVQLQKTLFLIKENFPRATGRLFYRFTPYNYGPFNAGIYSDAEKLANVGLVDIDQPSRGSYSRYSITPAGRTRAEALKADLKPNVPRYIDDVVRWAKSLTFTQLVKAIYDAFPEQRQNSVFRY